MVSGMTLLESKMTVSCTKYDSISSNSIIKKSTVTNATGL